MPGSSRSVARSAVDLWDEERVGRRRTFFFFFSHTSTFQLLDKPWSQVSYLLPPGSCLEIFIAHRVQ